MKCFAVILLVGLSLAVLLRMSLSMSFFVSKLIVLISTSGRGYSVVLLIENYVALPLEEVGATIDTVSISSTRVFIAELRNNS
jgi:hypothetical protein